MLRFFLWFFACYSLQSQSLNEIRDMYVTSYESQEKSLHFFQLMENITSENFVILAYKGASKMIYAKYGKNRTELLKEGKSIIENSVQEKPDNIEIRLIRLSVQKHLPKIIPYRKNIPEDKDFILKNIDKQDVRLQKYIKDYIRFSKVFSEEERKKII